MLRSIRQLVSDRKFRLFACACCRAIAETFPNRVYHDLVECAERFAEKLVTKRELDIAYRLVAQQPNMGLGMAVCAVADASASYAAQKTAERAQGRVPHVTREWQACLLREIVGIPFRDITFPSDWRTDTVLSLAKQMYDSREFGAMPILADALQDAGCENADILDHCRGPGPHVRGCWVVDLILGKE